MSGFLSNGWSYEISCTKPRGTLVTARVRFSLKSPFNNPPQNRIIYGSNASEQILLFVKSWHVSLLDGDAAQHLFTSY